MAAAKGHGGDGRGSKAGQAIADVVGIGCSRRRQADALLDALEQADAEHLFEMRDLPADRALRQIQLLRRTRETAMPGSGLEGGERRQRGHREAAGNERIIHDKFSSSRENISVAVAP